MQKDIQQSLTILSRYHWEYLYRECNPVYNILEDGVYLTLPKIVDGFTMADGMAEEFRDIGLEVEVLQSERRYYLKIPKECLENGGAEILKAEAAAVSNVLDDRYRTNIEITPLSLMPELAQTNEEKKKIARYAELEGFCVVVNLNELNLQVVDASRFVNRKGVLPNPDSEEPLSTYSLPEWQERVTKGQLYMTEAFQINRGTSPTSAIYTEYDQSSHHGLKVSDGKEVPGQGRHNEIFNRVLDSLVFIKKPDGGYDAYILPQSDIIQREGGYYTKNGDKIEHALSGIMSLCKDKAISLNGAARENEERPRLGVGIRDSASGKQLVIIIVQGGYLGCEAPNIPHSELIKMMRENGCRNVLTLDGGGTATMAFQGRTENARFHPNRVITHPGDAEGYRPAPGCTIIR